MHRHQSGLKSQFKLFSYILVSEDLKLRHCADGLVVHIFHLGLNSWLCFSEQSVSGFFKTSIEWPPPWSRRGHNPCEGGLPSKCMWIGEGLTRFFANSLASLAEGCRSLRRAVDHCATLDE